MLGRATRRALRVRDGEELPGGRDLPRGECLPRWDDLAGTEDLPGGERLPGWDDLAGGEDLSGGEHFPGWDDLPGGGKQSRAYGRPQLRLAPRWRRRVRGAGVGIVVAIPAMLVAHALVGTPSGTTPAQLVPGAVGASAPAVAAGSSAAAPRAVTRRRSPSPDSPRAPGGTIRHEGPSRTRARTREARTREARTREVGSAPATVTAAASSAPSPAVASAGGSVERIRASATPEFGFER